MGEWLDTTIGAQVSLQRGYDITKATQRPGDIPVVSAAGELSHHDRALAPGPGVVIARKGSGIGRVHYVERAYWPHDTTLWVTDFHGNVPRFVYYFFRWMEPRLAALDVGSANPTLNRNHVHPIRVRWPSIEDQRRIAGILGTLDDKIELNRRLSASLGAASRAIYRRWFVEGRTKSESGWRACTVGDLADIVGGSTPSTAQALFWERGVHHWVTPKDLSAIHTHVLLDAERMVTDAGLRQISSGLLPRGTVLMSSRAPIGYLAVAEVPVAINQGFIAMKPRAGVSNLFLLHWAEESQDEIVSRANGSTFLEISKSSFRPIEVLVPPRDSMESFDRAVRPLHELVVANERQTRTLTAARDALLPRLLSGELTLGVLSDQVEVGV